MPEKFNTFVREDDLDNNRNFNHAPVSEKMLQRTERLLNLKLPDDYI